MGISLYQWGKHPLIQLTDGRQPNVPDPDWLAQFDAKWEYRGEIDGGDAGLLKVVAVSLKQVRDEISSRGWCQLDSYKIQESWRAQWCKLT